jgi:hypothetical protein
MKPTDDSPEVALLRGLHGMSERGLMRAVAKLSDWRLAPMDATADAPAAPSLADAVPIEEWLEEMASALGDIPPDDVLQAMVADGFSADDARFLLLSALARYSKLPLTELSTAPAVKSLRGANPAPGATSA